VRPPGPLRTLTAMPTPQPPRPRTGTGSIAGRAGLLGLVAVVAGLLVAGLALPAVGGAALATRAGVNAFEALPADLDIPPMPQRSRLLDAQGHVIATFYFENRIDVPLSRVSPAMRQAIVDIEDARFYDHTGMDLRGTLRALVSNQTGAQVQGGSSLTQQYVKNVLVETAHAAGDAQGVAAARAVSYGRKLQELRYAVALEEQLSKDEILERYLNIAYFGDGAYGVEAAARHFFSVPAARLTLPQAATLAGLVRSPVAYDPTQHPQEALARRNVVLDRMASLGHLSAAERTAATSAPLGLRIRQAPNGCGVSPYPFYCDYVQRVLLNDPAFGPSTAARARLLRRGGLTIRTSLDPQAQRAAQQALDAYVDPHDRVAAAVAMVEPGTGAVRALAQSRRYGSGPSQTTIDYAVDKAYGASNGFQAGSTFKVFVAAAALAAGYPVDHAIYSPYQVRIGDVAACDGQVLTDPWDPTNELTSESGTYTMGSAMAASVNTYFAQLEEQVGVCEPWRLAGQMGVTQADGSPLAQVKSFTLGVSEVSPLTMAEAYATFAAHGKSCAAEPVTRITDSTGRVVADPTPRCRQVVDPAVADGVTYLLQQVMGPGGTGGHLSIGRPAAGKTGTTSGRVSVWFIGYTPQLAAAVWAGNPDSSRDELRDVVIGGRYYGSVCGGCLPGPIWAQTMQGALRDTPATDFTAPDPSVVGGLTVSVPSVVGMSAADATAALAERGLPARVNGRVDRADIPAGLVASTSPPAGASVRTGTTIDLVLSTGVAPPPVAPPPPGPGEVPGPAPSPGAPGVGPGGAGPPGQGP